MKRDPATDKKRQREQEEPRPPSVDDLPSLVKVISDRNPQDIDDSALEFRKETRAMTGAGAGRRVQRKTEET